ncbi:MAG: hypothetical protein NVS2B7_04460 [Herpetosiphon sp.]
MADKQLNYQQWTPDQTWHKTRLLVAAGLATLVMLSGLFWLDQFRIANRVNTDRLHSYQVHLIQSGVVVREMEMAYQGYVASHQDGLLEPFKRGTDELTATLGKLRAEAPAIGSATEAHVDALVGAATVWRATARRHIDGTRQAAPQAVLSAELAETTGLYDRMLGELQASLDSNQMQQESIQHEFTRLYQFSVALLTLTLIVGSGTTAYGVALINRLGGVARFLKQREDRAAAYIRVMTALNGPTDLQTMLEGVLPTILEAVGAPIGVVYLLQDGRLQPRAAVGQSLDQIPTLRQDEGLPGAALRQDRPISMTQEEGEVLWKLETGVGTVTPAAIVCVPLRYGNDVLGVLSTGSVDAVGDTFMGSLQLAASQLGTVISNVRAYDAMARQQDALQQSNAEIARRLDESQTLQEIGRELATQRDLRQLLELICRRARRLLGADYTAVATMVDRAGSTKWVASDGTLTNIVDNYVFPPHQGTAGRVIDFGKPVVIAGLETEALQNEFPVHFAEEMQAAFGVPLLRDEQAMGALIVAYRKPQEISTEMINLGESLAASASVAIENARLLAELSTERDLVRARAQELEEKNREVERANRLKSEFVANMSHELRTPLNSILALSQILADQLDGPLNDEQIKQVGIVERNGQNLLRLINDILDLSKIESGKLELLPSSFAVQELVESVQSVMMPLVAEKEVELRVEVATQIPQLMTDENKLKQVLLNLLSNAVKFTERGTITVVVEPGRQVGAVVSGSDAGWISFTVADTGIGIAPEDLPMIWDEFQQIDGSLSRRYEGTGLGLAIVRRLVRLLGGDIVARSVLKEGTTFTLSIPVQLARGPQVIEVDGLEDRPIAGRRTNEAYRDSDKPVVLVVDDDPEVVYILEKHLRDDGYEIAVATTGDEAIAKAKAIHPFAMTLDVMLPGRDGWDVIQTLKGDAETEDIPIIMLSMLDNRQLGYSLGASDYLVKPVARAELLKRLDRLHNGRAFQNALVVDDDAIEQRMLAMTLRSVGMTVTTISAGDDALRWLEQTTPDLITLDLMMPGMDGFMVLQMIKERPELKDVPVLIITAKEITAEDRARLNSRIAAIIEKGPHERDQVLREVRDRLEHHRRKLDHAAEVAHE